MMLRFNLLVLFLLLTPAYAQPRTDILMNADWRFSLSNPAGAETAGFDDAAWQPVTLPHTWNALDGQDGGNDYYRGIGWYRRELTLDHATQSKRIYLKFEAASTVAHVYVNGALAGIHKGGFSAFVLDVTPLVRFDATNIIAVRVDNAHDSTVAPLRGDFTIFGGLYRSVRVLVLDTISVSPLDDGSSGVYVQQENVSASSAELAVTAVVRNATAKQRQVTVRTTVLDNSGNVVSTDRSQVSVAGNSQTNSRQRLRILRPHLWDGRRDPYLYKLIVETLDSARVTDRVEEPLGIRSFRVDPDSGFFLNGRPYRLAGVNRHQDRKDKGWAIGMEEHEEDYRLMEEMGCTAVRLAHYQQAKEIYDLCDRGGMIVWAELALVDFVHPDKEFRNVTLQQLRELIKQNYNHPSIIFWSLFNELIPDKDRPLYASLVDELNTLSHELDPARPTAMASRSMYDGSEYINSVTDVVGYNVYKGWYEEMPEDFAAYADELHKRFPQACISIGEYGAGASPWHHEVPPAKPQTVSAWHPEEWQSVYHEAHWLAMATRPYLWGTFVWNMFDFASDSRREGDALGINDKGLVTHDRTIKKDAFYWYKANWNPEPMVYITSRRYTPRPAGTTEVKVYSNCSTVTLYVNGLSLGSRTSPDRMFRWDGVELLPGTNTVEVVGESDGVTITDKCTWKTQ